MEDADGQWGACNDCHALIQAGDRAALAEWSYQNLLRKLPHAQHLAAACRSSIRRMHDQFFAHQDPTEPVPATADDILKAMASEENNE